MPIAFLYAMVVLIWGTTWYAIKFQLGVVAPEISLIYRMGIAALCLFVYARMVRSPLQMSLRNHGFVALQALGLFSVNYWLTYLGTQHLTSGIVAVLFTSLILMNIVNARVILGQPVEMRVLLAALVGMAGVALIFLPELRSAVDGRTSLSGVVLVLCASYAASLGNIAAMRNTGSGLSVVSVNAYGLVYGTAVLAIIALVRGVPVTFDVSFSYIASLLYLALAGTAMAFGCYLALIKRIGAARAAYSGVLYPVVALVISTAFEGYHWSWPAVLGLAVLLGGNALALTRRSA